MRTMPGLLAFMMVAAIRGVGHGAAAGAMAAPVSLADDLAVASPASMGLDLAPLAGLATAVARGDYPKTTSVLVVYRGKLVYEDYFPGGGRATLNDTRSATKSITALAVGAALADGALASVQAPAFADLDDLAPFKNDTALKRAITLEDLLTMSSALDCDDDNDQSPGNEDRMHEQTVWTRWAVDLPTKADYRRGGDGRGPFSYCTAGAVLLGQIVQRATATPVDQYIKRRLLRPLGIRAAEWPRSPSGEVMTGGGLRLRSRDLAKLAWMLADDGRWGSRQIVPASWIAAVMTEHTRANAEQGYGYLFWQRTYKTRCGPVSGWYMAGNGGNAIVILRPLDAAVVVTRQNYNTRGMHEQTISLLERQVLPALPCPGEKKAGL